MIGDAHALTCDDDVESWELSLSKVEVVEGDKDEANWPSEFTLYRKIDSLELYVKDGAWLPSTWSEGEQ